MFRDDFVIPQNGKIIIHINDYKIISTKILSEDQFIVSAQMIMEIYQQGRCLTIHKDDIPDECINCQHNPLTMEQNI